MALTQQQIELCSQEGANATQNCVDKYRTQFYANIERIHSYARIANEANRKAFTDCKEQVPGGCPPRSTADTQENRNICEACWEAYTKEERRIASTEFDLITAEERLLEEKTKQRYDPLGNPKLDCECCNLGREVEAACKKRGATPIVTPVNPTVPPPGGRPRDILDDAMEERTRKLWSPIPM